MMESQLEERMIPPAHVRLPPFEKCCCFSLRTGCLILGWLNEILCAIVIIICSVLLAYNEALDDQNQDKMMATASLDLTEIMVVIYLVILFIAVLIYGLLLFGVYKNKPSFIKAFVIIICIGIVISIGNILRQFGLGIYSSASLLTNVVEILYKSLNAAVAYAYLIELQNKLDAASNEENGFKRIK